MTLSTALMDTYRSLQHPPYTRMYLSVVPKTSIFDGQIGSVIDRDPDTLGVYAFSTTTVSGNSALVDEDMVFSVSATSGGKPIGFFRVRKPMSGSMFYPEEISLAESGIQTGRYISVYRDYRLFHKKPRLKGVRNNNSIYINDFEEYHDYDQQYTNQNNPIRPLTCVTGSASDYRVQPKYAGFVVPNTSYRDVTLSAQFSQTTSSVLWDVGSETIISGTPTSTTITVRVSINNGVFRWFGLTVAYSSGKQSVKRYIPIWVHDEANPPIIIDELNDLTYSRTGVKTTISFKENARQVLDSQIGQGFTACLWEVPYYNNAPAPTETLTQNLGWIDDLSETFDQQSSQLSFKFIGLGERLNEIQSFQQHYENVDSAPTKFDQIEDLTVLKVISAQLIEYSTFPRVGNFFISGTFTSLGSDAINVNEASLWSQLEEMSGSVSYLIGADRTNGLHFKPNLLYMESTLRSSRPTRMHLQEHDWRQESAPQLDTPNRLKTAYVRGEGSSKGSSRPFFYAAIAPGRTVGESTSGSEYPYQYLPITGAQNRLNQYVGMHFAYENESNKNVQIVLSSWMDVIEPAWDEPITLSHSATNIRGNTLSNVPFRVESISVQHDFSQATKTYRWTLLRITEGAPGEPIEIPEYPDYNSPYPETMRLDQMIEHNVPNQIALFTFLSTSIMARTMNYNRSEKDGGPNWELFDLSSSLPSGESLIFVCVDPFCDALVYRNPSYPTNAYGVTSQSFVWIEDIFGSFNIYTTPLPSHPEAISRAFKIEASKRFPGHAVISTPIGISVPNPIRSGRTYYYYTTDYGSTWTLYWINPINPPPSTGHAGIRGYPHADITFDNAAGELVSSRIVNAAHFTGSADPYSQLSGQSVQGCRTIGLNHGLWTYDSRFIPPTSVFRQIQSPYPIVRFSAASSTFCYYTNIILYYYECNTNWYLYMAEFPKIFRNQTNILVRTPPNYEEHQLFPYWHSSFDVSDLDPKTITTFGDYRSLSCTFDHAGDLRLWISRDGGQTWRGVRYSGRGLKTGRYSRDVFYLFLYKSPPYVSNDGGFKFVNKRGDYISGLESYIAGFIEGALP